MRGAWSASRRRKPFTNWCTGPDARCPQPGATRFWSASRQGSRSQLIAAGAGAFFKEVTFTSTAGITIRAVVGSLLILFGLMQLNVLPVSLLAVEDAAKPLLARQARLRRDQPALAFGLFGFGYLLAGFRPN